MTKVPFTKQDDMNVEFHLNLCTQPHQTDLMSSFNRDFWDSLGGS